MKRTGSLTQWAIGAGAILLLLGAGEAAAQAQYKPGDRVMCNLIGMTAPQYEKYYEPGTVLAFRHGDGPDGSWYRVKADSNGVEYYCKLEVIRPIANAAPPAPQPVPAPAAPRPQAPTPAPRMAEIPAGTFLDCPIEQPQVQNGARPDPELLKKLIRCKKGEKSVPAGQEGAVQVVVSAVQVGTSRPWTYRQDTGSGQQGTIVFPVKATYTVKTLYRAATEVEENWVRIFNVYVDAFGEWQIGSEEPVRPGKPQRIPNN